jgi:hypothetical protein
MIVCDTLLLLVRLFVLVLVLVRMGEQLGKCFMQRRSA